MINYTTHDSNCFNPMRRLSVSVFSTWICVQAASSQLIPHHFWRAQAGKEPVEGASVPGAISMRFCPVHPLNTAWIFCWVLLDPFYSLETQFRTKLSQSDFEEWDSQHFCLCSSQRKLMRKTPSPPCQLQWVQSCNCFRKDPARKKKKHQKTLP